MDRATSVGDPLEIGQADGEKRVTRGIDTHHLKAAIVNSASITPPPVTSSFTDTLPINQPFLKLKAPYYKLTKVIGKGSFGTVYLATHQLTGLKVAVKVYCRQDLERNGCLPKVFEESRILWALSGHPHIVQIYECVETRECVYIVMEYVPNGDLHYYGMGAGPRPPQPEARRVFQQEQIISAIEYCHMRGVSHHDIKSENILIDANNDVKVADFGLSCDIRHGDSLTSNGGTRQYAAPEIFSSGTSHSGRAADVWSCGVILYALLCGRLPFEEANISHLTWRIQHADYETPTHLSEDALDLLTRMLKVNPTERITIPAIRQHRFFQPSLPPYIARPASTYSYQLSQIDVQSFISVVRLGCGANYLLTSLWQLASDQRSNQATVAYFAVVQSKNSQPGQNRLGKLSRQLTRASQGDVQVGLHVPSGAFISPGTDARWTVGLQGPITFIWATVKEILKEMGVTWRNAEKCFYYYPQPRAADPCASHSSVAFPQIRTYTRSTLELRFTLELSRVPEKKLASSDGVSESYLRVRGLETMPCCRDSHCLLDLQKQDGSLALFHDTCGMILSKLLAPS